MRPLRLEMSYMKPLMFMLLAVSCLAQMATPEPEMADIFYRLDHDKLVPLERQSAAIHGNAHGFIVMSIKTASEFPGAKSSIKFNNAEQLDFVVRSVAPVTAADPNTM